MSDVEVDAKEIPFKEILRAVCKHYKISMLDIVSERRYPVMVRARVAVAHLALQHTRLSRGGIAMRLSRTPWTIDHYIETVQGFLENDKFFEDVKKIKEQLAT